jgi:hypothetical protein
MMRSKKTAVQTKAQARKAKASAVTRAAKSERASRRTVHTNLMGVKVPKTLGNALIHLSIHLAVGKFWPVHW